VGKGKTNCKSKIRPRPGNRYSTGEPRCPQWVQGNKKKAGATYKGEEGGKTVDRAQKRPGCEGKLLRVKGIEKKTKWGGERKKYPVQNVKKKEKNQVVQKRCIKCKWAKVGVTQKRKNCGMGIMNRKKKRKPVNYNVA